MIRFNVVTRLISSLALQSRSLKTSSRVHLKREPVHPEVIEEGKDKKEVEKKDEPDEQSEELLKLREFRSKLKDKYASNPEPLMEFFEPIENWGAQEVKSGRSWKLDELRIKSNSDLHKLWYILLKERNMLLTMQESAKESSEQFANPERFDRVEESMANLEDVVKERNKAYYELEVAEGETGARPVRFRRDFVGRHAFVECSEHLIPMWMNHEWRYMFGPCHGPHVQAFLRKLRERKAGRIQRQYMKDKREVRQLLRRFPDVDMEYLQEKYPRVDVHKCKKELQYWWERDFISPGTNTKRIDEPDDRAKTESDPPETHRWNL